MSDKKMGEAITEQVAGTSAQLLDWVKGLIAEGNLRRLVIRKPDGDVLLQVPLTVAVAIAGAITILVPVLAALGAMAALVAKVRVDIVPNGDEGD